MATALITGINRGLGLELTRQYLTAGWQIIGTCRSSSPALDELAGTYANKLRIAQADMLDLASLEALKAELGATPIDVLILSAGTMGKLDFGASGMDDGGFQQLDYDDWATVMAINVLAPMRLAELLVDNVAASDERKIVAFSSMLGSNALNQNGGLYTYRSSKAALNAVVRSLGHDLAERNISVLAIHPGWVRTDMGGPNASLTAEQSVSGIINVIAKLGPDKTGQFMSYTGEDMPW